MKSSLLHLRKLVIQPLQGSAARSSSVRISRERSLGYSSDDRSAFRGIHRPSNAPRTTRDALDPAVTGAPRSGASKAAHLTAAKRRLELGTIDAARIAQSSLVFAGIRLPLVDFIVSLHAAAPRMVEVRLAAEKAAIENLNDLIQEGSSLPFVSASRATMRFARKLDSMRAPPSVRELLADQVDACIHHHLDEAASRSIPTAMQEKLLALPGKIRRLR